MLPLKSSTNKYSLNLVYKDTKFRVSKMTDSANAWGVAMLIRNKIISRFEGASFAKPQFSTDNAMGTAILTYRAVKKNG